MIKVNQQKVDLATKQARVAELKQLLQESDFKTLPDYDQDATQVLAQRQAWRDEVRQLELELGVSQ